MVDVYLVQTLTKRWWKYINNIFYFWYRIPLTFLYQCGIFVCFIKALDLIHGSNTKTTLPIKINVLDLYYFLIGGVSYVFYLTKIDLYLFGW